MAEKTDLQKAFDMITGKVNQHTTVFNYYDGVHPLVYANERLRDIFAGVQVSFTENWCRVVIDSMKDRIQLTGFDASDEVIAAIEQIWQVNEMDLESDDLHEAALVTGEAYLIAWPDENNQVQIYYNDPRMCHMFYEAANPRQPRMAAKLWVAEDETYRLTLYYPDRLEYYRTAKKAVSVSNANAFVPDDELGQVAENPYGEIPVFHFRLNKRRLQGDLVDVVPVQNGVNKLLTDMMVAAEYGAFKQRWIISNSDTSQLKNAPNEIWSIPGGDGMGQQTSVGEFSATDLGNYLNAVNQLAGDIARITRTPKHYFYTEGGDPSGEALYAMEAPLIAKVQDRIKRFKPVWARAMAFALRLSGKEISAADLQPVYEEPSTVQPMTEANVRLVNVQAGIPLVTQLKREGWSQQEIDEMQAEQETQQAKSDQLGEKLLTAFEKGEQ